MMIKRRDGQGQKKSRPDPKTHDIQGVDLMEGEKVIHITKRHWTVLVVKVLPPILALVFFGGMALFRAIGGTFFVLEVADQGVFDFVNILFSLVVVGLLALWLIQGLRRPKDKKVPLKRNNALVVVAAALLLLGYFRFQGGRVFYMDPVAAPLQTNDPINMLLLLLAALALPFIWIAIYDWNNDDLILTESRVIFDNDQVFIPRLLERRVQEQIKLEDIQDVISKSDTYAQHWLGFGTIIVKSARIGGGLVFEQADQPKVMQEMIDKTVKANRKQRSENEYQELVQGAVYGNKKARPVPLPEMKTTSTRWMNWLLPANPEIDRSKDTVTWRPHWIFMALALMRPLGLFFGSLILVIVASRIGMLGAGGTTLVLVLLLVVCGAWSAYEVEDYRNDQYILTPTNVTDVEAKPYGPQSSRKAGLGAIQNITYETTFISNFLGYGDVFLETAGGGGKFTFTRVPRPRDVVARITDYVAHFKQGDKERSLNDALALLRHYHTLEQARQQEASSNGAQG